jgi:ATP-dependent Clp protease protease subunit
MKELIRSINMRNALYIVAILAVLVIGGTLLNTKNSLKVEMEAVKTYSVYVTAGKQVIDTKITVNRLKIPASQVVTFNVEVNELTIELTLKALTEILSNNPQAFLIIDSPGGSVFAGTKLTSFIEGSSKPIYTICVSVCASMGAHIFEAGTTRFLTDNAVVMFHPASGGLSGTVPEMKSTLLMIDKYTARMDAKVAKRAGIPVEQFEQLVLKNLWINVDEALSMKLADASVVLDIKDSKNLSKYNIKELAINKMIDYARKFNSKTN